MEAASIKVDLPSQQSHPHALEPRLPATPPPPLAPAPPDDHALAAELATRAGELLLQLREAAGESAYERWSLRDDGDLGSHHFLVDALREARPEDRVLSEEGLEDVRRLDAERVWIVDPLDGTREFGELDRSDWAVHVALVVGGVLAAGAVALPALGVTLSTNEPPVVPAAVPGQRPRLVVSRTRFPAAAVLAAETIGADLVPLGSAGAKAMAVVRGEADAYAHAGGQYEWDSAAPAAVAIAAGLHVSGVDGSALVWNKPDPWQPHLLVCRPEYADPIADAVRAQLA
jgi:3'(2'), 5'-bisphosphate nucleotidase